MNQRERYQLRYAAGQYWLLDMKQQLGAYKRPMSMNEMGAQIWQMLRDGLDDAQIAAGLGQEYDADLAEIQQDVMQFRQQLIDYGVRF